MSTKLYVGNISDSTSERALRELFENFGQLEEVAILKGYGFVVSATQNRYCPK